MPCREWCCAVALLISQLALVGSAGAAGPSAWDVARDPDLKRAYRVLVAAERAREPSSELFDDIDARRLLSERAGVMLKLGRALSLPDVRLQFLLGETLAEAGDSYLEEARRTLRGAIERSPDSPLVARALFNLALVSGKLRDHRAEHRAYGELLELEWHPESRATIYLNRAESSQALLMMDEAIADYRQALASSSGPEIQALARWGLAVAHDRDRDAPQALLDARQAMALKVPYADGYVAAIDLPAVVFVPEYERHYYRALGLMALGLTEPDSKAAIETLQSAALFWSMYLSGAEPEQAPWVIHARAHRARCLERTSELKGASSLAQ